MTWKAEDEAALAALCNAAPPEPWAWHETGGYMGGSAGELVAPDGAIGLSAALHGVNAPDADRRVLAAAAWIAQARTALPAALAEIARLRAALTEAQTDAREWQALAYDGKETAIATEHAIRLGQCLRERNWLYAAMDRQRARLLG